ncbi:MAG: aldo/keto reductase [Christensenellaceae bacterium]|jgi:diketogulonate reductase-like aldo/keto reductase
MSAKSDGFVLPNGVEIPSIGFGTWQSEGEKGYEAVKMAIRAGYTHIDTAAIYETEGNVGRGVRDSGVDRKTLFVTTKLWNDVRGYEETKKAFNHSLTELGFDYVDMYLIHWPRPNKYRDVWEEMNWETWRAMEEQYDEGKVRAIGVSNFYVKHMQSLMEKARIMPMVNQIEYHPGYVEEDTAAFCKKHHIAMEGYSPLGTGRLIDHPLLVEIAKKYGKSTAQVCIRWVWQHGVLPIVKSVQEERILQNKDIFDFELAQEDMLKVDSMEHIDTDGHNRDDTYF